MNNKIRLNRSQLEYLLDIKERRNPSSASLGTAFKPLLSGGPVEEGHPYSDICDGFALTDSGTRLLGSTGSTGRRKWR